MGGSQEGGFSQLGVEVDWGRSPGWALKDEEEPLGRSQLRRSSAPTLTARSSQALPTLLQAGPALPQLAGPQLMVCLCPFSATVPELLGLATVSYSTLLLRAASPLPESCLLQL